MTGTCVCVCVYSPLCRAKNLFTPSRVGTYFLSGDKNSIFWGSDLRQGLGLDSNQIKVKVRLGLSMSWQWLSLQRKNRS